MVLQFLCQTPTGHPGCSRQHQGKPEFPGLNLLVTDDKYLQLPHPQVVIYVSYLKGNVMAHRRCPFGFISVLEMNWECFEASICREKMGNGMVTIMARRYARDLTTKSSHLNMTRTLPCRNYTHCYWWGNWGLVRLSDFTTISNVAIKCQRWDINPSLSDTNFEFSTLYSSSVCCTDKKAWPFDWDHLLHFIRSPRRLQLGSPKNLGTVKVGRFLLLSRVYM